MSVWGSGQPGMFWNSRAGGEMARHCCHNPIKQDAIPVETGPHDAPEPAAPNPFWMMVQALPGIHCLIYPVISL